LGSGWRSATQDTVAACARPTAAVEVIVMGRDIVPDSSIQAQPVSSPLPLRECTPAAHGS